MCGRTIKTYKNTRHILIEFLSISIYRAVIRKGVGSEGGEEGEGGGTQILTPSKPSTPRLLVFLHTSCPSSPSRTPVFLPPLSLPPPSQCTPIPPPTPLRGFLSPHAPPPHTFIFSSSRPCIPTPHSLSPPTHDLPSIPVPRTIIRPHPPAPCPSCVLRP